MGGTLAYAREGASLAICSRSADELASVARELEQLRAAVLAAPADVSAPAEVAAFVDKVLGRFARVDVLVNNAGVLHPLGPVLEIPVEEWDRTMAINRRGAWLMACAVIPHMVRQKGGSAINVSSGLGREAYPGYGAYGVSKWGLEGLTLYLALELKPSGVRVNSVAPGYVGTAREVLKRATTAEKLIPWISDPLNVVLDLENPEAIALALKKFFDTYVATGQRLSRVT